MLWADILDDNNLLFSSTDFLMALSNWIWFIAVIATYGKFFWEVMSLFVSLIEVILIYFVLEMIFGSCFVHVRLIKIDLDGYCGYLGQNWP